MTMYSVLIDVLLTITAAARLAGNPMSRELLKDIWYRNRHEARMAQLEYDRARRAARKSL